jgi:hypothetical protein
MTLANGILYAGAEVGSDAKGSGRLYAFTASCGFGTCGPLWVSKLPRPVFGLAVADGVLVVGTYGEVSGYEPICADPGGCPPLWTGQIKGPAIGMVVVGGTIYVQDQASGVYAFPVACGTADARCRPRWRATGFFSAFLSSAPPAVANGLVFVGGTDGKLYVFAASCVGACTPLRTIDTGGGHKDWIYLNVTENMIFTAGGHSLVGFGLSADHPGA